jgi:hypothetical protein
MLHVITEEEIKATKVNSTDNSKAISRRIRMKSSDMSKSFTETRDKRQQSLHLVANQVETKKGGRMLSLNADEPDNSLKHINVEEEEIIEKKNRLIRFAKLRQLKQNEQNNL